MAKRLYVGNLSYETTKTQLEGLFSGFDSVTGVEMVSDRRTGRFRGFAFVALSSDEQAVQAVRSLNGKNFLDRDLVVNEARAVRDNSHQGRRGGFGRRER